MKIGFTEEAFSDFAQMNRQEMELTYATIRDFKGCRAAAGDSFGSRYRDEIDRTVIFTCENDLIIVLDILGGQELTPHAKHTLQQRVAALRASNHIIANLATVDAQNMTPTLFCDTYLPEVRPTLFRQPHTHAFLAATMTGAAMTGSAALVPTLSRRTRKDWRQWYQLLATRIIGAGRRWGSTEARQNYATVMKAAGRRPQIIDRDGEDFVVISAKQLDSFATPKTAGEVMATMQGALAGLPAFDITPPKNREAPPDIETNIAGV